MNQNDSSAIITQVITLHHVLMGITPSHTRWLAPRSVFQGHLLFARIIPPVSAAPVLGPPQEAGGTPRTPWPDVTARIALSLASLYQACRPRTEPKMIKGPRGRGCFFLQSLLPWAGERKYKTSKHTRSPCSQNQGKERMQMWCERGGRRRGIDGAGTPSYRQSTQRGTHFPRASLGSLL